VDLSGFDFAAALRCFEDRPACPEVERLARYWLSLWRDGRLPSRGDFQPKAVGDLLPALCLFDVVPNRSVRCRLVGSRLVEAAGGVDITGRDWIEMTAPSDRRERMRRFSEVARGAIGRGMRVGRRQSGERQYAEEIMLPFDDVAPDGTRQVLLFISWTPSLYDPTLTGLERNRGLLLRFALTPLAAGEAA